MMGASLLAVPSQLGELSIEGVDDRAQGFGIDRPLLASLKLAHGRL
jgi:hypothetical protein